MRNGDIEQAMPRIKYHEAAGLEVRRGRPALIIDESERALVHRLYILEGRSTRDVAAIMKIGEATVRRRLRATGVELRSNAKRSRLRALDHGRLFGDINEIGVDRTARKWGIPERTLKSYLARLRREADSL